MEIRKTQNNAQKDMNKYATAHSWSWDEKLLAVVSNIHLSCQELKSRSLDLLEIMDYVNFDCTWRLQVI